MAKLKVQTPLAAPQGFETHPCDEEIHLKGQQYRHLKEVYSPCPCCSTVAFEQVFGDT